MCSAGGHCDSSQSLSKEGLLEAVSLTIPNITERDDDDIEFEHLSITQPGYLVSWSFVGRSTEGGENFPERNYENMFTSLIRNTRMTKST